MSPEQEDVTRRRLDGEVFGQRPDGDSLGVENDFVITGIGDGSPVANGRQFGRASRTHLVRHGVVMKVRTSWSVSGHDAA